MDFRKILILGIILAVVFSAAGIVSALDDSLTVKGTLIEGTSDMEVTETSDSIWTYTDSVVCDVDLSNVSSDDMTKIKGALDGKNITCNLTDDEGYSTEYADDEYANMDISMSEGVLHIRIEAIAITFGEADKTHSEIAGGNLTLPCDSGDISIEF